MIDHENVEDGIEEFVTWLSTFDFDSVIKFTKEDENIIVQMQLDDGPNEWLKYTVKYEPVITKTSFNPADARIISAEPWIAINDTSMNKDSTVKVIM